MLDIKFIRENKELVKQNSKNRLVEVDIEKLIEMDEKRRLLLAESEDLRSKRNKGSKEKPESKQIEEMKKIGENIKRIESQLKSLNPEYKELLMKVPNITHEKVRVSDNEDDNPVIEIYLKPTKFDFEPKDHVALSDDLDLIEFERASKITGAKFYYLKNELVLMELALIQYALKLTTSHGFIPFLTPDLAKKEVLEGLGFNPRGESTQVYNIEKSDLSLVGTAEITLGGLHMDETLNEKDLPKQYVAVSHCFRTEAGSYSKYSKGLYRVHQFTKIEMFQYSLPENSWDGLNKLLEIQKEIFKGINIPFRIIDHCTADLGTPSSRTYDLEAWMPGKPNKDGSLGDWGEITSCSNCTDYQSRALNIKYEKDGQRNFIHTLNGTAIAVSRAIIAIMENNQTKEGNIIIPEVLRPYMNGIEFIKRK